MKPIIEVKDAGMMAVPNSDGRVALLIENGGNTYRILLGLEECLELSTLLIEAVRIEMIMIREKGAEKAATAGPTSQTGHCVRGRI